MDIRLSTALHMSYTVRAATATAVSASISTPVFASPAAVGPDGNPVLLDFKFHIDPVHGNVVAQRDQVVSWHRRWPRSGVASTSPFWIRLRLTRETVSDCRRILPQAVASRRTIGLALTSTMTALPADVTEFHSSSYLPVLAVGLGRGLFRIVRSRLPRMSSRSTGNCGIREQAGLQLAVGRETDAVACGTVRGLLGLKARAAGFRARIPE